MSFNRLSTKYRPKRFGQVVGQPEIPVVKALIEDLDALPPLLLFAGPSGVGKTTAARIVAASINCEERSGVDPCGKCASCQAIQNDSHPDVHEEDAASSGTADALRELANQSYLQSRGTKVFILDEAQSISHQGWNVLLKLFEEPPERCLYILLTSEPRKVPHKIRTRALRFNFKHLPPKLIRKYLETLVEHDDLEATDRDLSIVVDLCDGSLRDALMMLDQVTTSRFTAEEIFGNRDLSRKYLLSLITGKYTEALDTLNTWWDEVGEARTIIDQTTDTLEKLLRYKTSTEFYTGDDAGSYMQLGDNTTMPKIAASLSTISDWYPQVFAHAQLVLLTTKLYKDFNGAMPTEEEKPKEVEQETSENNVVAGSAAAGAFEGM